MIYDKRYNFKKTNLISYVVSRAYVSTLPYFATPFSFYIVRL